MKAVKEKFTWDMKKIRMKHFHIISIARVHIAPCELTVCSIYQKSVFESHAVFQSKAAAYSLTVFIWV